MNAVIYTKYYNSNNNEYSIEQQEKICYEYAEKNGYNVINDYADCTGKREQFHQMLKDSENKEFQVIIVSQLDRFARNRYDSAMYKHQLRQNGVKVISATENISNDASGILIESVLEGMAEYFSLELDNKIKRQMKA